MKVSELIERLQKLENQNAEVLMKDTVMGNVSVTEIEIAFQSEVKIPGQIYQPEMHLIVLSEY